MKQDELQKILADHVLWLRGDAAGARANLGDANLGGADLGSANLGGANQEKSPVPAIEGLHQKILAAIDGGGKLDMSQWHGSGHACETTHCRAGWAVHLAGEVGRALECCLGTPVAAALIELASEPALEGKVPNYYSDNEPALADIKRLAEIQAGRAFAVGAQKSARLKQEGVL